MKPLTFFIALVLNNFISGQNPEAYKLLNLHTLNTEKYEDFSVNAKALQMPNGQKLFVGYTANSKSITEEKRQELNIPDQAIFAISSNTKDGSEYYYALVDDKICNVFKTDYSQEEKKVCHYVCVEDHWILKPQSDDLEAYLSYRNEHWQPDKGQYYFSEQYVYSYIEGNQKHNFSFYFDPFSGTVLLRKDDSFKDEMIDYIIVRQKQDYIMVYTDEFGQQKQKRIPKPDFYPKITSKIQEDYLVTNFDLKGLKAKSTSLQKAVCIEETPSYDYNFRDKTNTKTVLSLAFVTHDLSNLNLLSNSKAMPEDGLLIPLFNTLLPGYLLPVKEVNLENKVTSNLECVMATDFHVALPVFEN